MRGLIMAVMTIALATTGFAQSRHGAVGGYGRGFVSSNHAFVGAGRTYAGRYYGGYGYGAGLGYSPLYTPYCYGPYYYGAYNCGYPLRGYYAPPVARMVAPRGVMAPRPGVMVGGGWRHFGRR